MKKNIFILILVFLVVGLSGYIAYDKYIKPSTKGDTKKDNKEVTKEKTSDERYKEYLDNLAESIKKEYINKNPNEDYSAEITNTTRVDNEDIEGHYFVSINDKLELITTAEVDGLEDSVIANNVVSYYVIRVGNGGFNSIYYITTEGKVYSANVELAMYNKTKLEIKEVDSVKNIVEIKNGNSIVGFPIFVDIDGNIIIK